MNTYWTEAAQLYLILHQSFFIKIIESQIWSSGSSEEHLFPEALLSLFLSGGMIFISHLLRSVYFFISQSALHHMFGSFQSHLTKTYYWDLEWWLIFWSFYPRICSTVDLQASEFHLLLFISGFTFMHLSDAFIQSNLQCIQAILLFYQYVFPGNWTHDLLRC